MCHFGREWGTSTCISSLKKLRTAASTSVPESERVGPPTPMIYPSVDFTTSYMSYMRFGVNILEQADVMIRPENGVRVGTESENIHTGYGNSAMPTSGESASRRTTRVSGRCP